MEAQHMSQQTFANFIGINAASLSSIFNNRTKPTLNTVEAIKSKIPNLNTDWLMFGHGTMFEETVKTNADGSGIETCDSHELSKKTDGFGSDLFNNGTDGQSQHAFANHNDNSLRPEIRYMERPQRQITEIRVYFDDLTYETFVPKK